MRDLPFKHNRKLHKKLFNLLGQLFDVDLFDVCTYNLLIRFP